MRRHQRRLSVLSTLIGIAVGAILVATTFLVWQGPTIRLNGRNYAYETETLFGSQSYLSFPFRGVTFTFHLWCQITPDTGIVCGNATELDGASFPYSFSDGLPMAGNPPWQTWVSPDGAEAVEYQQGGTARLLVEVL